MGRGKLKSIGKEVWCYGSVDREEDQNAAWLSLYIFNKDVNEQYKNNKRNVKNRNSPIWCKQTQRPKEYGCLNMVPNQRQR